ncbi:MAG: ComEC/Rec2 family competence protein, partial [Planctomycetes bacterium]|nr:ComEC/Rec2 family competence protein [Planctomycetota bacterium]
LLAISGFHVSILAALLCAPLARLFAALLSLVLPGLRGHRLISPELLRAALVLTLVPLSGSGAPVMRAACAWALASLAPLVPLQPGLEEHGRRPDSLSAWALALLLELLADPRAWQSVSIQLSYAAALGLILTSSTLGRLLRGRDREEDPLTSSLDLHPLFALPLALLRRLRDAAITAVAASVVAVLSTAPIVWHHFGELAPAGVLATPLAALFITPLLLLGWLDLWLSSLMGVAPFQELSRLLTHALLALLVSFDGLPATPVQLPLRPQWLVFLACASTLWVIRARTRRRLLLSCAAAAWIALLSPRDTSAETLEVHALDVGHGTCVVFRAPGSRAWIFDAGSRDRSQLVTAALFPLLRSWGNPPVVIVCSHADSDHARALPRVASRFPPELWLGAITRGHALESAHLDVETGALSLKDGPLRLELHRGLDQPGNEGSRSLVIHYQSKRVVLSGDAEGDGLDLMLHQGDLDGPTDLLLAPHHGSDSPWLGALLQRLSPSEVWVSAGAPPAIGPELDRRGLPWRSTAAHGPLSWTAEGQSPVCRPRGL